MSVARPLALPVPQGGPREIEGVTLPLGVAVGDEDWEGEPEAELLAHTLTVSVAKGDAVAPSASELLGWALALRSTLGVLLGRTEELPSPDCVPLAQGVGVSVALGCTLVD